MTMTDPVADLLTRIRNMNSLSRKAVTIPHSKMKQEIVAALKREGFIADFEVSDARVGKEIKVTLKYGPDGEKVINKLERISRPGRRSYRGVDELTPVLQGMGITILSTSKGVLSDNEARAQKVGGEVLCRVY